MDIKSGFEEMLSKHDAGSPSIGILRDGFAKLKADLDLAKKKNYASDLVPEMKNAGLSKIEADYENALATDKANYEAKEREARKAYDNAVTKAPDRDRRLLSREREYSAFTKEELRDFLFRYDSSDGRLIYDAEEADILAAKIRQISGEGDFKIFKKFLEKHEYRQPWKRLLKPEENEMFKVHRERQPGQALLRLKSNVKDSDGNFPGGASLTPIRTLAELAGIN